MRTSPPPRRPLRATDTPSPPGDVPPTVHVAVAVDPATIGGDDDDPLDVTVGDGVSPGDTVIGVGLGREWAVVEVFTAKASDDGEISLVTTSPWIPRHGLSVEAVGKQVGMELVCVPQRLEPTTASLILDAIATEIDDPTPWYALESDCAMGVFGRPAGVPHDIWGCVACGRDTRTEFAPRLQLHGEDGLDEVVDVCPSCHDILHQPVGPAFDELMYGMRPACPRCQARAADHLMLGMPPGPPPRGVSLGGCVIDVGHIRDFVCTECGHEW